MTAAKWFIFWAQRLQGTLICTQFPLRNLAGGSHLCSELDQRPTQAWHVEHGTVPQVIHDRLLGWFPDLNPNPDADSNNG